MLRLENVSKYYYSGYNIVLALRKINLEFKLGEFIAITGESGSGKSTLLNVLSGLDTYEDGKVFINDKDISHYTVDELEHYRKDYIGFVFQDYNIIDSYTVYQNIEMALTVQGKSKEERHQRVLDLIEKVGLTKQKNQKAIKLSGGEKQRTVIARTLAKNCQILVCDEPTGNLDSESSDQVLSLLAEISKDKLVIIVTHDFETMRKYASRKIRLYDGEVIEDNIYKKAYNISETEVPSKTYYTRFIDTLNIAVKNVFSVPKKSFFTMIILMFLIIVTFFTYGNGIIERNKPYSDNTPYFDNADKSRIIVTKYDNTKFTEDELTEIDNVEYVRTVFNNDPVFDVVLITSIFNQAYQRDEFFYYKVLSSDALNSLDLIAGELPTKATEIVIGDNDFYEIGDYIAFSNSFRVQEFQGLETSQFVFKVVGITEEQLSFDSPLHSVYLHKDGLTELSPTAIFSRSQMSLHISGTEDYITANEEWVTDGTEEIKEDTYMLINNIWVDNSLDDFELKTFDMMFFDMCRDFGYKKEIRDDVDAGLCDSGDFIDSHEFTIKSLTTFENEKEFIDIEISSVAVATQIGRIMYMNETTYNYFFGETNYQVTAVVYDGYEGKIVVEELRELGYKAYYPSQIIEDEDAWTIIVNNVRITVLILAVIAMTFFVGYFVLRNIIMSKRKDYLIYRSLGTSKKTINIMLYAEILFLTFISAIIVLVLLLVLERYKTPIPQILRYLTWIDYLVIYTGTVFILGLMIRNFSKRIFDVSVISSLKGIEQ